jgi:hypothetical protein
MGAVNGAAGDACAERFAAGRPKSAPTIHDWCRERCGQHGEAWAVLGATFYFAEEGMAEEFRKVFGPST